MRFVASSATIARATAPRRSDQGARLKKTHHTTIANAQTKPPIAPKRKALGTTTGRTYLTTHSSTAAATPGHNRSGFRGVGTLLGAMGMSTSDGSACHRPSQGSGAPYLLRFPAHRGCSARPCPPGGLLLAISHTPLRREMFQGAG